jgi:hypothetical protein
MREQLNISIEDATGSLAPHWDPYVATESGLGHGMVTEGFGKTWKWQQVALGVTIGIPIDEWDDSIHVLSEDFIVYGDHDRQPSLSSGFQSNCTEGHCKRWDFASCRAALDCTRDIVDGTALNIGAGWGQAVRGFYAAKYIYTTLYDLYVPPPPLTPFQIRDAVPFHADWPF